MEKVVLFLRLSPYLAFLFWGVYAILEVIFPSLRDPDFNRWEIDADSGAYVEIAGWKKALTPPRVLARGHMSDRAACTVALVAGIIFILVAIFGIRHTSGFPTFFPDVFGSF